MYKIKEGCVGCHYCKLECPEQAIRIKDGRYQIDDERCIGCGKCAGLCHLGLITDTDNELEISSHAPIELDCDIVVVGAGGVGTAAAAKAADLGYDVILLEAAKNYGGGTYLAHGASFPGSRVVVEKFGTDSAFEQTVNMWVSNQTGKKTPIETIRSNVAGHGEFFDWFAGLDPDNIKPFVKRGAGHFVAFDMAERYLNKESTDDSIGPGWMGSWITDKLFDFAMKRGVRYYNETRVRAFILDDGGKVAGLKATDPGGEVLVKAKIIILGTGGYIMNDNIIKSIDPDLIRGSASYLRLNVPTNVGDGHDMIASIGGDVDYTRAGARGPTHHPYCFIINKIINMLEIIFVTDEGDRKFELSTLVMGPPGPVKVANNPISEIILRSKTGKCWALADADTLELCGGKLGLSDTGRPFDWRREIEEEAALDDVPTKKADSIEELAQKLGMKPERLWASVDRWNSLCAEGADMDLGKAPESMRAIIKPPFYAFLGQNFDNGASRGGISIDGKFRPLTKEGAIIERVYCAGDAATYSWTEDIGPIGLCGGLCGSWSSGCRIAVYADEYLKTEKSNAMTYVIDQENCSCCHRCRVECPSGAIRYKNSKYWIDPQLCVGCGHCATVCHNNAIYDPHAPASSPVPHELIRKECDVLVIGGGGAGLAAAARAADLGKRVIVLEKNIETGGSAWYAHMLRVHYSKWHKDAGLEDKRERIYRRFMEKTGGRIDGGLMKRILNANSEMIDWLIDKGNLGDGFELGQGPFGALGLIGTYKWEYNDKRPEPSIGPGNYGWYFVRTFERLLKAAGGEIICNANAVKLLTDETGRVTGVFAKDPGGELEIRSRAVIVTAGSFTRSREIMNRMQPKFYDDYGKEPVHILTCSTCTGDGITMCEKLGADIDYENRRVNMFGPAHCPFNFSVMRLPKSKSALRVDLNGRYLTGKFMDGEVSMLADLPGRISWCIVDSKIVEDEYNRIEPRTNGDMCDANKTRKNLYKDLEEEIGEGVVVRADSVEDLAKRLGMAPEALEESFARHSADIANGKGTEQFFGMDSDEDSPFVGLEQKDSLHQLKTPPYYAIFEKMFHENAMGGIVTDGNLRVLKNGSPIPGLFAAGDNIRGIALPGEIGVRYVESICSALTFAFNSGFAAGEEACAYTEKPAVLKQYPAPPAVT